MKRSAAARYLTTWNPAGLSELAGCLAEAELSGTPCHMDLSDTAIAGASNPSAVRLYVPSIMLLANLLVGRFRNVPVSLQIPEAKGLNLQLARGGFFYALANRPNVTWARCAPEEWNRAAETWTHPFHPGDQRMRREALVDVRDAQDESWVVHAAFQRYLLSVMHPHRRPAAHLYGELRQIAGRWLSGRLDIVPGSEMISTLSDCLEVFYEIVVNVPDHAGLRSSGSGCSLGQVYATMGGGRHSHNRLHFSVMDNGIGLRRRVNRLYPDDRRTAEHALRDAAMGKLPQRLGGRGLGLDRVRNVALQYREGLRGVGGATSIRIVTNGHNDDACQLDWQADTDHATTSTFGVPVKGTLVWVSLGLAHRLPTGETHQLELTFA